MDRIFQELSMNILVYAPLSIVTVSNILSSARTDYLKNFNMDDSKTTRNISRLFGLHTNEGDMDLYHLYINSFLILQSTSFLGEDKLDYGSFLSLAVSKSPSGLGLSFKKGEADDLFNKLDINKDGKISLQELLEMLMTNCPNDVRDENKIPVKKRIALVAHDKNKEKLVEWCRKWKSVLINHSLMGTGTTAGKV